MKSWRAQRVYQGAQRPQRSGNPSPMPPNTTRNNQKAHALRVPRSREQSSRQASFPRSEATPEGIAHCRHFVTPVLTPSPFVHSTPEHKTHAPFAPRGRQRPSSEASLPKRAAPPAKRQRIALPACCHHPKKNNQTSSHSRPAVTQTIEPPGEFSEERSDPRRDSPLPPFCHPCPNALPFRPLHAGT